MNTSEILTHVDHTQLKAYAGWEDIIRLCEEAIRLKTASVCVPPCYVPKNPGVLWRAGAYLHSGGFPSGLQCDGSKGG